MHSIEAVQKVPAGCGCGECEYHRPQGGGDTAEGNLLQPNQCTWQFSRCIVGAYELQLMPHKVCDYLCNGKPIIWVIGCNSAGITGLAVVPYIGICGNLLLLLALPGLLACPQPGSALSSWWGCIADPWMSI